MGKTIYDKIYDSHIIFQDENTIPIIYIDLHLLHEVTSPQAFLSLIDKNRDVRRPEKNFATMDHNVPTHSNNINSSGKMAKIQMQTLIKNCKKYNISLYDLHHPDQGIVHIVGPEKGLTLPGTTIVCGDSHTSTHGAFGALSFGIGTSEVEHVLATQTLSQRRLKNMKIQVIGHVKDNVSAKDIALYIVRKIGTSGGTGYVVEFCGETINNLTMEGRMTICNMAIEMGAKSAIIAPDNVTYKYLKNRTFVPKGSNFEKAIEFWKTLKSDVYAKFDKICIIDVNNLSPQITWGTNPSQVINIEEKIPFISSYKNEIDQNSARKSLEYMNLKENISLLSVKIDKVFIGSCTNGRIEDLREAADVIKNKKISNRVHAIVVPGSKSVKFKAEKEGLDKIFKSAGFEWRLPGCSMCLGMNKDVLNDGERCASTSNRNFEGRQGRGGRTHLVSPRMAAAAAIHGKFVDVSGL